MTGEQVAAAAVLAVLGVGVGVVGRLGRRGTMSYALGGWTPENSTPESRAEANRVIGSGMSIGSVIAMSGAVLVLAAPPGWAGPLTVVAACASALVVVIGVVIGVGRVRAN